MLNMLMHWSFSDHLWGGQRWRSCEHLREALKCKGAVFTNMKGKYWHSMNLHVQTPYAHPSWIWFQVQGTSNLKVGCYSFKLLQSAGKEGAIYNATNSVFATQDQFWLSTWFSCVRLYSWSTFQVLRHSCWDIISVGVCGRSRRVMSPGLFPKPVALKVAICIYAMVSVS